MPLIEGKLESDGSVVVLPRASERMVVFDVPEADVASKNAGLPGVCCRD
ncbi:MAG: hypothetical protein M2R45_01652 [Verrucomicrobia subdivision 3 bacterium]|nr:hypothetical protein [Limisphaerales bacterium]MCS1412803.1 hypothetical protein [Limisphaerales bacterium]